MPGAGPGAGQALGQGRRAPARLEGILGRDQPPDPVQPQPAQRLAGDGQVALVGRVEGATEEADALARAGQGAAQGGGQAGPARGPGGPGSGGVASGEPVQGRTCPDPRTRYL